MNKKELKRLIKECIIKELHEIKLKQILNEIGKSPNDIPPMPKGRLGVAVRGVFRERDPIDPIFKDPVMKQLLDEIEKNLQDRFKNDRVNEFSRKEIPFIIKNWLKNKNKETDYSQEGIDILSSIIIKELINRGYVLL